MYPQDAEPLFWVHINIDVPFHLKGVLYFPKIHRGFDFQSNAVHLFCNRVFVSDNCKDLLPDYLMVLKGAIDSPDIPLNVSRSHLQMDKTVRSLAQHISKKILQKIEGLYKQDQARFLEIWPEIEMVVKLGILQEENLYEKAKNFLVWNTLDGKWLTLEEIQKTCKEGDKKTVYYTTKDTKDLGVSKLYKEKNLPVLLTQPVIDNPLMQRLEDRLGVKFQRIDSVLEETLLDKGKEKTLLNAEGKSESALIEDFVRNALDKKDLTIEAKSLASADTPAFFLIDEQSRRFKEFMMSHSRSNDDAMLPQKKTFVINTNNLLITKAFSLKNSQPNFAKKLVEHVYDLARLSQKEINTKDLSSLVERSQEVLQEMIGLIG